MRAVFIEASGFTEWVSEFLSDDALLLLQHELMANPTKGTPIVGCGGLRKIRLGDPRRGQGKRSGARVIYLYVPETRWFFMIDIYGKNEKDDLTPGEKKQLRRLSDEFKASAQAAAMRRKGTKS
jgi:hypothetical protein